MYAFLALNAAKGSPEAQPGWGSRSRGVGWPSAACTGCRGGVVVVVMGKGFTTGGFPPPFSFPPGRNCAALQMWSLTAMVSRRCEAQGTLGDT